MNRLSDSDLHLTFRNWSSSNSDMSDTEHTRRRRRQNTSSEPDGGNYSDDILTTRHRAAPEIVRNNRNSIILPRPLWINPSAGIETTENDTTPRDATITGNNDMETFIDPDLSERSERSIRDRRRELSVLFNVLRETSENTEWGRHEEAEGRHRRFPIGFINSHFRFTGREFDHTFDLDHNHSDEDPENDYVDEGIFDSNIRLRNFKNRFAKSNVVYGNTFFKKHPDHEMEKHIHIKVEKFGLTSLLDQLLVERSRQSKMIMECALNTHRKRTYNDACFMDNGMSFLINEEDPVFTPLQKSSYLRNGNTFSSATRLNDVCISLKFTEVDYDRLTNSGYFQIGNVKLGFTGKIVDFVENDLRYDCLAPIMMESNAFSNLLRNKLIHSTKFNKLFDKTTKKSYNKENWKPFSMNRMGYLKLNRINSRYSRTYDYPHLIQSLKSTKFPNGSVFHKMKASGDNQLETFKFLSKWFDIAPLNQFNNTPAPPTPPNNLHKCTNNPENLLVCEDCINMIMSKYIFLKLVIDVDELFEKSGTVFSDYIYKHRRRFNYYASKLAKKNNHNLRTHMERNLHRTDSSSSFTQIPSSSSNLVSAASNQGQTPNSDESQENLDSRQGTPEEMLNRVMSSDADDDANDTEMNLLFSDNEIGFSGSSALSLNGDDDLHDITDSFAEPWPLSNERTDEYHPILDPMFNEESEDDFDSPYNYIIHNDNRRISRLLFNINMVRQQYTPSREPLSAMRMYKGNKKDRLKLVMMVSINRKTGELQMSAGNVDPNSWSSEQNDGELFEDVETFSKVFNLFMNDKEEDYQANTEYTKEAKRWIKRTQPEEAEQIKKILALQILTNPSILNGYKRREDTKKQKLHKHSRNSKKAFKEPNPLNSGKRSLKRKRNGNKGFDTCLNDDLREKLQLYMDESKNFEVDPNKVLTMQPGHNSQKTETNGHNLSFMLE